MDESAWPYIAQVWPGILASVRQLPHLQLEAVIANQLGMDYNNLGRGSEARAGLNAVEAADGDHVPVSDLIPVGAPDQNSVLVSHVRAPFHVRT
jgi:hypothetical protein